MSILRVLTKGDALYHVNTQSGIIKTAGQVKINPWQEKLNVVVENSNLLQKSFFSFFFTSAV